MRNSIIILAYSPYPVFKESFRCLFDNYSKVSSEIIIVDNHSPDQRTRDYLDLMDYENVFVVDAGENIGRVEGFKLGLSKARGDVIIKYDDDVYTSTRGFDNILASYVQSNEDVAYCSANLDVDPCSSDGNTEKFGSHYFREDSAINFSLMAWTKKAFEKLGGIQTQMASTELYSAMENNHRDNAKSLNLREMCCISLPAIRADVNDKRF